MTLPSTRPTVEELDRTIRQLNDNYRLNLYKPDPTLSPSKRRLQNRTDEDRRVTAIYDRIRVLHYKRDSRLTECLGHFYGKAAELSKRQSEGEKSTFPLPSSERAILQRCLLDILPSLDELTQPIAKRAKRLPDEVAVSVSKRPRSRTSTDTEPPSNAVDALPVRSSNKSPEKRSDLDDYPQTAHEFSESRTTVSTRQSNVSEVFSAADDGQFQSQTTIETNFAERATQDSHALRTREQWDFANSFSHPEKSRDSPQLTVVDGTEYSSAFGTEDLDALENFPVFSDTKPLSLDDRLQRIWPKFPTPGLNQAPLAVQWEVTRAAIQCGADLANCKLQYEATDSWHNQHKMRSQLLTDPAFIGKGLPPAIDARAWEAAIDKFQTRDKAVALSAELVYHPENDHGPLFDLHLEPLRLEIGHRLSRRFGADRFIEITMPSPTSRQQPTQVKYDGHGSDKIIRWLTQNSHYFLGRSWVAFHTRSMKKKVRDAKSGKIRNTYPERVWLFATDGIHFRIPPSPSYSIPSVEEASTPGKRTKLSLEGLLRWAIALAQNTDQPVPKLFSRISLSLTRAVPTAVLEPNQIRRREQDLGTDEVMNDGVGQLSRSLARKVADQLGLSDTPSAFQGRIGSAKGMWIIDVQDNGLDDWIEIYPSQEKWKCDYQDVHHRTFEVKDFPRELKSASLNQQFIPVLEARCQNPMAMRRIMAGHTKACLRAELDALKTAMDHPMDLRLWMAQSGPSRDQRSRFEGHVPFVGGLPDKDEDKIALLLDAGFAPKKLDYLEEMIYDMGKRKADLLLTKMNIKIPCSANAFMVADFENVLEEGEVHLSFSTKFQADRVLVDDFSSEAFADTNLEGFDILVARSPAHFPTDIQKVRAVSKPELRGLKDVIVFSTKGKSPLADVLSGGDYDGDKAWICWDKAIVDNFQNATTVHTCPNLFEMGYLRKSNPKFQELIDDSRSTGMESMWDRACVDFMYRAFTFNMEQALLGECTNYKERYCYWRDHRIEGEAVFRLSTLLGLLVDQAKQGTVFSRSDWHRFRKEVIKSSFLEEPQYMKETFSYPKSKGPMYVLDYLKGVAMDVIHEALTDFDRGIKTEKVPWDNDLTRLCNEYDELSRNSKGIHEILLHLKKEIRDLADYWREQAMSRDEAGGNDFTALVKRAHERWANISPPAGALSKHADKHVARLHELWSEDRQMTNWELLKASTTFKLCYKPNKKFVWWVAGRQLAALKARARPSNAESSSVLVTAEMWAVLRPDNRLIKFMAAIRNAGRDGDSMTTLDEMMDFDEDF